VSGSLVQLELPVQGTDRAKAFRSGMFGWLFGDSGMPEMDVGGRAEDKSPNPHLGGPARSADTEGNDVGGLQSYEPAA
jgi:predicted enzyme related to lactoylglutathione lyase